MQRSHRRNGSSQRALIRQKAVGLSAREEFLIPLTNGGAVSPSIDDPTLRRIVQRHRCRISFLTVTPPLADTKCSNGQSRTSPASFVLPRCRVRIAGEDLASVRRCCRQLELNFPAFANRLPAASAKSSAFSRGGGEVSRKFDDDARLSLLCAKSSSSSRMVPWRKNLLLQRSVLNSIFQLPDSMLFDDRSATRLNFLSDACSPYFTQTDEAPDVDSPACASAGSNSVADSSPKSASESERRLRERRRRRQQRLRGQRRKSADSSKSLDTVYSATLSISRAGDCELNMLDEWLNDPDSTSLSEASSVPSDAAPSNENNAHQRVKAADASVQTSPGLAAGQSCNNQLSKPRQLATTTDSTKSLTTDADVIRYTESPSYSENKSPAARLQCSSNSGWSTRPRGRIVHRRIAWFLRASAARLKGKRRPLIGLHY